MLDLYIQSASDRFKPLLSQCSHLGISSVVELPKYFEELNTRFDVRNFVLSTLQSPDDILNLIPEMMTKGRCDNTIVKIDNLLIHEILTKAINGFR